MGKVHQGEPVSKCDERQTRSVIDQIYAKLRWSADCDLAWPGRRSPQERRGGRNRAIHAPTHVGL